MRSWIENCQRRPRFQGSTAPHYEPVPSQNDEALDSRNGSLIARGGAKQDAKTFKSVAGSSFAAVKVRRRVLAGGGQYYGERDALNRVEIHQNMPNRALSSPLPKLPIRQ